MKLCRAALLLLLFSGCTALRPGLTRCPVCGWLVEPLGTWTYRDAAGPYQVTFYDCYSATCGWTGGVTNRAIPAPKYTRL